MQEVQEYHLTESVPYNCPCPMVQDPREPARLSSCRTNIQLKLFMSQSPQNYSLSQPGLDNDTVSNNESFLRGEIRMKDN
ncbi:hypothetical protein J6590_042872 [Homalodisca vitripennis]|nr:hypothetical protein J6590_042872 [Homalodisca vitripennis]